jgi:hypothetical protein
MKTISLIQITNSITELLSTNTLDAYYCNKHPFFDKGKLLGDKLLYNLIIKYKIGLNISCFSEKEMAAILNRPSSPRFSQRSMLTPNKDTVTEEKLKLYNLRVNEFNKLNENYYENWEGLLDDLKKIKGISIDSIPKINTENKWSEKTFETWFNENVENEPYRLSRELEVVFPFLDHTRNLPSRNNTPFCETSIFHNSFVKNISVPFDRVIKSFENGISIEITNKSKNDYSIDLDYDIDNIVPIVFSLKKCFNRKNIITTENGILYLDMGNGIIAKIYIRENVDNLKPDIKTLGGFIKPTIFSGYSHSGYYLNKGIYIITNDLIFEVNFSASPFLIQSSTNQPFAENISNDKLIADEEQKRIEELYED